MTSSHNTLQLINNSLIKILKIVKYNDFKPNKNKLKFPTDIDRITFKNWRNNYKRFSFKCKLDFT